MGENPRDRRDGRRGRKTSLRVGGKGEFLSEGTRERERDDGGSG
jgi:hypothetical protein